MATRDVIPFRGKLSIDGKLVEPDAHFPVKPAVGDLEWGEGITLRVDSVVPFMEGPEQRYHVHASRKS